MNLGCLTHDFSSVWLCNKDDGKRFHHFLCSRKANYTSLQCERLNWTRTFKNMILHLYNWEDNDQIIKDKRSLLMQRCIDLHKLISPDCCLSVSLPRPPATPPRWWRPPVGSPWSRLILTWWPRPTAPWRPLSARSSDPRASASNNPNSLTARRQHTHTHLHTYTETPPSQTHRDKPSPRCYLLHDLQPPPNLPLLPHPILLYLVSSKDGGKKKRREEEEEEEERDRWACDVDVCRLQKNHNNLPFFSSALA